MNFRMASVIIRGLKAFRPVGHRLLPRLLFALALASLTWAAPALATNWTFDWAALGWSPTGPGSQPRLYTNVAGSGIDVRVTLSYNNTAWLNSSPILNNDPGQGNELTLQVDFGALSNNPKANVLFEFFATGTATSAPVAINGIAVRDLDNNNSFLSTYRDVITVTGVTATNATIDPTFISQYVATPNWTLGPGGGTCVGCTNANTVRGTGGSVAETDQSGWAAFNFTTTKIKSMSVLYSPGDGSGDSNPSDQFVWLSDFEFSDTVTTTQAVIASFAVHGDGTVEWATASEVGTAGFNLLRLDPVAERFIKVNDRLLPALIGSPQGGVYRYPDPGVTTGARYTYELEEIEATGSVRRYGPFTVVAGAGDRAARALRAVKLAAADAGSRRLDGYTRRAHTANGRAAEVASMLRPALKAKAAAGKSNDSVRILVEEDGLFAVTADEIAAALGTNLQNVRNWIGRNQLRLQNRGRQIAWMADPGKERLYFYGEAIGGDDTVHTRYNVYWLDRANGLAMKVVEGRGPVPVVKPQSFASRVHAEEKTLPAQFLAADPDADFWYWNYVVAGDADSASRDFPVPSPGAMHAGPATIRAHLHGATDLTPGNDHHAKLWINGTEIGNLAWDGIVPGTLSASFDASLLAADGNNTVAVSGELDAGVDYSVFWVKGFDLDYSRAYQAAADRLRFDAAGNRVVTIGGFSGSYIAVLDIGDPRKPRWIAATTVTPSGTGYAVSFAPTSSKGDYFAAVAKSPVSVDGVSPSDAKSRDNAADYLVLTPKTLRAGANVLAAYRGAKVVELQDIYDGFNFGIANPNAIQDFLAYAHQNWKPKPRYVALVGKGTIDPKGYTGYGTNLFPVLMSSTPNGLFASDNRYADFNDNGVPEIAIGRIPALTSDDVIRYVAKLTAYERNRAPANQALLVADAPDDGGDFTADSAAAAQALLARGFAVTPVDLEDMSLAQARQTIIDTLNSPTGVGLFNYIGHGGVDVLANGAVFGNGDVGLLTNAARLPVFLAFTCAVGDGSYPGFDSLAETLLWREGGGAVAAIAPTGLSDNAQAHALNLNLVETLAGPRASATLGDANAAALAGLAKKGGQRYMLEKYNITGDPALRVRQ